MSNRFTRAAALARQAGAHARLALHYARLALHVIVHKVPLSDRLAVALSILLVFTLCGVEIDAHRLIDVFAYALCEVVSHLVREV